MEIQGKGHPHRNTFALKHYRTDEAKDYCDKENRAFRLLRYQDKPRDNIVAYYGGFERENEQGNNYYAIFEFADGGNLDQYMERTQAPTNHKEQSDFWENFVGVLEGLAVIHEPGIDISNEPQTMLG